MLRTSAGSSPCSTKTAPFGEFGPYAFGLHAESNTVTSPDCSCPPSFPLRRYRLGVGGRLDDADRFEPRALRGERSVSARGCVKDHEADLVLGNVDRLLEAERLRRASVWRCGARFVFCRPSVTIDAGNIVSELVGREQELATLDTFIGNVGGATSVLVLAGEAGIGKSTLWLAGVELARARGLRVLSSRPAENERSLAHVGLGDLFEDVLDDVLPTLAAPRRYALEVALLLEPIARPVDRRAVAVAVRGALQLLSDQSPLLIAVDDVQWLDPSSSSALAFALRRPTGSNVSCLLARRVAGGDMPSELEGAFGSEHIQRVPIGPLSVGALHRLLRDRLGRAFGRQTLLRIHERSGGNPFFALELRRR